MDSRTKHPYLIIQHCVDGVSSYFRPYCELCCSVEELLLLETSGAAGFIWSPDENELRFIHVSVKLENFHMFSVFTQIS